MLFLFNGAIARKKSADIMSVNINNSDRIFDSRILIKTICAFLTILLIAALAAGCGSGNAGESATQAATEAATTTTTTTAPATTTEAATEPILTEDIEDAEVDGDFINLTEAPGDNLPNVATVAGHAITQPEYKYMLNSFKSIILLNTGIDEDHDEYVHFWTRTAANGMTRLDEARERVLAELHQLKICEAIAEDRGIVLGQDELENISTDLRAQENRFGGRANFEKVLMDEYGVTIFDYWKISESIAIRDKLLAHEWESIVITDGDARNYFDQNKHMYGDFAQIRFILFLMEGADMKNERTPEETEKLANETLEALKNGADMEALARETSEDPGAAINGGGRMLAGNDPFIPESILEWVFNDESGGYEIIETSFGYYVVTVEERVSRGFEDVKDVITDTLKEQALTDLVSGWMKDPVYAMKIDREVLGGIS